MQLSEELIKEFELEYLHIIIKLLESGEITVDEAKESAQYYLTLLPYADMNDLQTKTNRLIEKYSWTSKLNIFIMNKLETFKTKDVLEKMRSLMHENKIDDAINLTKT